MHPICRLFRGARRPSFLIPAALGLALTAALAAGLAAPARAENATAPAESSTAPAARTVPAPGGSPEGRPPARQPGKPLAVLVEHAGEDRIGERLAFQFKEALGRTQLFRLARDKEKGLRVRISTRTEIAERPDFGSACAVTWLLNEGPEVLSYYLDGSVELVHPGNLGGAAEDLVARTDKVVTKFSYLFQ